MTHDPPRVGLDSDDLERTSVVLSCLAHIISKEATSLQALAIEMTGATTMNPALKVINLKKLKLCIGVLQVAHDITAELQPDPELQQAYSEGRKILERIVYAADQSEVPIN